MPFSKVETVFPTELYALLLDMVRCKPQPHAPLLLANDAAAGDCRAGTSSAVEVDVGGNKESRLPAHHSPFINQHFLAGVHFTSNILRLAHW